MAINHNAEAEVATVIADYTLSRFSFLKGWQQESPSGIDFPELSVYEIAACDKTVDLWVQAQKGEGSDAE